MRKILILSRPSNTLEIQDEDDEFSYQLLHDVTHIKSCGIGIYAILNKESTIEEYKGCVTNVKEVRELWV